MKTSIVIARRSEATTKQSQAFGEVSRDCFVRPTALLAMTTILLIGFLLTGCSKNDWMAKYYLFQAENAFNKAYSLRIKQGAEADRTRHYQKAHDYYLKAYSLNRNYFTLAKIEQAHDTCLRLEDSPNADLFQQFGEEYAKAHPKEVEYGDVTGMVGLE